MLRLPFLRERTRTSGGGRDASRPVDAAARPGVLDSHTFRCVVTFQTSDAAPEAGAGPLRATPDRMHRPVRFKKGPVDHFDRLDPDADVPTRQNLFRPIRRGPLPAVANASGATASFRSATQDPEYEAQATVLMARATSDLQTSGTSLVTAPTLDASAHRAASMTNTRPWDSLSHTIPRCRPLPGMPMHRRRVGPAITHRRFVLVGGAST